MVRKTSPERQRPSSKVRSIKVLKEVKYLNLKQQFLNVFCVGHYSQVAPQHYQYSTRISEVLNSTF
jgi:hypothetical protein